MFPELSVKGLLKQAKVGAWRLLDTLQMGGNIIISSSSAGETKDKVATKKPLGT
jgi:hypothetical protein